MATKERYQNPVVGDLIKLKLFVYNSNNFANVKSVEKIEIYRVDNPNVDIKNTNEGYLVETISGSSVTQEDVGVYLLDLQTSSPSYTIGYYYDVWTVVFENEDAPAQVTNIFQIYPDLWYSSPTPIVYDFNFQFRPNKLRKGSKRYIIFQVTPNVPRGTDLERYYENLAIVGDLKISMEQRTGNCLPKEQDLRIVLENAPMSYREKMYGYYLLDTTEMEIGIYDVWYELDLGGNTYISDRQSLQIFD